MTAHHPDHRSPITDPQLSASTPKPSEPRPPPDCPRLDPRRHRRSEGDRDSQPAALAVHGPLAAQGILDDVEPSAAGAGADASSAGPRSRARRRSFDRSRNRFIAAMLSASSIVPSRSIRRRHRVARLDERRRRPRHARLEAAGPRQRLQRLPSTTPPQPVYVRLPIAMKPTPWSGSHASATRIPAGRRCARRCGGGAGLANAEARSRSRRH